MCGSSVYGGCRTGVFKKKSKLTPTKPFKNTPQQALAEGARFELAVHGVHAGFQDLLPRSSRTSTELGIYYSLGDFLALFTSSAISPISQISRVVHICANAFYKYFKTEMRLGVIILSRRGPAQNS